MSLLLQLKKQNEQLIAEKLQTEADIATVALTLKEVWQSLGIKEDTFKDGKKPSAAQMLKIASTLGRKLTPGKGREELMAHWDKVSPILEKYQHVIKEKDV